MLVTLICSLKKTTSRVRIVTWDELRVKGTNQDPIPSHPHPLQQTTTDTASVHPAELYVDLCLIVDLYAHRVPLIPGEPQFRLKLTITQEPRHRQLIIWTTHPSNV